MHDDVVAVLTGGLAGALMGFVLQRSQLCFHAMFAGAWLGRTHLVRGWLLGVGVASVGLSLLYLAPWSAGLNTGLAFRPVQDVTGGLVIGVGMVVARSCVSGLFYKLGAGMLGALVAIATWIAGELVAVRIGIGGPTVLRSGFAATLPGVLGVSRLVFAVCFLGVVLLVCRWLSSLRDAAPAVGWPWPVIGIGVGLVTVAGWVLARLGGSRFGPSTVGASHSVSVGSPNWWLIAFLLGIVAGGWIAARTSGELQPRGETRVRYLELAVGGFLLGAGGWIAGGCNLGHGVSGVAQLNVSSWVVVLAMVAGVGVAGLARRSLGGARSPTPSRARA